MIGAQWFHTTWSRAAQLAHRSSGYRVPVLPVAAAGLLLLVSGFAYGIWTQRWGRSGELEAAAARLEDVPLTVADWHGEPSEMDPEMIARASLATCKVVTYTQARTNQCITVLLMCGRSGPASVHTPEWCYGGAGYELTASPVRYSIDLNSAMETAECWTAVFVKPEPGPDSCLRILWSWSAAGDWQAPTYPRLTFGRSPVLYKLYVVRPVSSPEEPLEQDPGVQFLREFLPILNQTLFPAAP